MSEIYVFCKALQRFSFDKLYLAGDDCDLPQSTAVRLESTGYVEFGAGSLEESIYSAEESQRIWAEKQIASQVQKSLIWTPPKIPADRIFDRLDQEAIKEVEDSIPNADPRIDFSLELNDG